MSNRLVHSAPRRRAITGAGFTFPERGDSVLVIVRDLLAAGIIVIAAWVACVAFGG